MVILTWVGIILIIDEEVRLVEQWNAYDRAACSYSQDFA
jgi:hypothetical protein